MIRRIPRSLSTVSAAGPEYILRARCVRSDRARSRNARMSGQEERVERDRLRCRFDGERGKAGHAVRRASLRYAIDDVATRAPALGNCPPSDING